MFKISVFRAAMCHFWVYIDPPPITKLQHPTEAREERKRCSIQKAERVTNRDVIRNVNQVVDATLASAILSCWHFPSSNCSNVQGPMSVIVPSQCCFPGWASSNVASTWCGNNIWLQGQWIVGHATGGDRLRGEGCHHVIWWLYTSWWR